MAKKYLSLERLTEYDELIKAEIAEGDAAVKSYVDDVVKNIASSDHDHDDRYYTETEIDSKISVISTSISNITNGTTAVKEAEHAGSADEATLATKAIQDGNGKIIADTYETKVDADSKLDTAKAYTDTEVAKKADVGHKHDDDYDAKGSADTALASAKSYTDGKVAGMATTTTVANEISAHNTSTTAHGDIRELISDLSTKVNNFLDVDDTTTDQLSEVLTLINNNKGTLESLTSGKVNVSDIIDNLETASTSKVLSANQGVVIKALIDALQLEVDGKANAEHDHGIEDVTGLQSALNAKATQADLISHTGDTTVHITSAERTAWNAIEGNAKTYTDGQISSVNGTLSAHTGNADIHFTAAERTKLAGIAENANNITVDTALSATSLNPVANKVLNDTIVATSNAILANTNSINTITGTVSDLQTAVNNIEEITSQDIINLFNK